jgi:hypothetical protein
MGSYVYKRRVLRPDSPALVNYEPTSRSPLTPAQKQVKAQLERAGGRERLDVFHAASLAGLLRRGLVEYDDTHVWLVKR